MKTKKFSELFKNLTYNSLYTSCELWEKILSIIYTDMLPFKESTFFFNSIEDDTENEDNFNIKILYKKKIVKNKNIYFETKSYILNNFNLDYEIEINLNLLKEKTEEQKVSAECVYYYSPTDLKEDLSFDEGLIKAKIEIHSEVGEIQNCREAFVLSLIRELTYAEMRIDRLEMFYCEKDIILAGKINQLRFLSSLNKEKNIEEIIKSANINFNKSEIKKVKKIFNFYKF